MGDSLGATAPAEPAVPLASSGASAASTAFDELAIPPATAAGWELSDDFEGLACSQGLMTIAGFGSLLSETSARSTFPELQSFRTGRLRGWRRIFAHCCDIFFARGIARPETREVSSLSVEEHPDSEIVVSLFEVEATPDSIAAFIQREHEFRFMAVEPLHLDGSSIGRRAVVCARWNDEEYRRRRCPPDEWQRRYGKHGVTQIWLDDVRPCRVYLRHCVLAAQRLGPEAYASFLDSTYLSDRRTTVRQHLELNPGIMEELPPPSLIGRYSGTQLWAAGRRSAHPMFDLQALCDTMGAPTPMCSSPGADAGAASSTIFVINEVLNASGGRTGCFLYRGTLASAAPRSRTPDACCPPPRSSSPSAAGAGGALLGAGGESPSADLAAYEGQEMTLYMSYEEASPKMRQRVAGRAGGYGGGALGAPWRVALRDANDDLVYCARGLPLQAHLDEELRLACWGPSVTLAFPSSEDARTWAAGLSRVGVQACSLADSCAAMALVAHAAQQALAGAGPHKSRVATPAQSCPPSPSRTEQPLAGSKRKAEAAGLATPMMRPRGFATITPNCSCGDLADLLLP